MEALPPAEDVPLRAADDALDARLEIREDTELPAELAEAPAPDVEFLAEPPRPVSVALAAPLEKMVVLPTVLVMVLLSVVIVERIAEVVIAPTCSG